MSNYDSFEHPCGDCKSFDDGFCYRFFFPVQEKHAPCTKFKLKESEELESTNSEDGQTQLVIKELFEDFLDKLTKFKEGIIGRPFDEIYIDLDTLIEEYENKLKIYF
ncbi:MAG: hypothetical protein GF353_23375 [Candidatus Lokiarchaeota archaeon]|nr:hypothetical protein [Candidatus Lokiarchaeota archaeon]